MKISIDKNFNVSITQNTFNKHLIHFSQKRIEYFVLSIATLFTLNNKHSVLIETHTDDLNNLFVDVFRIIIHQSYKFTFEEIKVLVVFLDYVSQKRMENLYLDSEFDISHLFDKYQFNLFSKAIHSMKKKSYFTFKLKQEDKITVETSYNNVSLLNFICELTLYFPSKKAVSFSVVVFLLPYFIFQGWTIFLQFISTEAVVSSFLNVFYRYLAPVCFAVILLCVFCAVWSPYSIAKVYYSFRKKVLNTFILSLFNIDLSQYAQMHWEKFSKTVQSDLVVLNDFLFFGVFQGLCWACIVVLNISIIIAYSLTSKTIPPLYILILFHLICFIVLTRYMSGRYQKHTYNIRLENSSLYQRLNESFRTLTEITVFNIKDNLNKNCDSIINKSCIHYKRQTFFYFLMITYLFALISVIRISSCIISVYSVTMKGVSSSTIFLFDQAFFVYHMGVLSLSGIFPFILNSREPFYHMKETFLYVLNTYDTTDSIDFNVVIQPVMFTFVKCDVGSHSEQLYIKSLDFCTGKSKSTTFVGRSGSGKSTITKSLLRILKPFKGHILMNNISIDRFTYFEFYSIVTSVFQEPVLFNESIIYNILLDNEVKKDELIDIAKRIDIYDDIQNQAEGFETKLGLNSESLSGGQKQKIAILRSILRDGDVYIMDEITSALDSKSKNLVNSYLDEFLINKTSLCVSHNFTEICKCENIVFLNNGEVVEMGTHDELMKLANAYYNLFLSYTTSERIVRLGTSEIDLCFLLKKSKVFETCNESLLKKITNHFKMTEFAEGTVICKQGEKGDTFFIIVSGLIEVYILKNEKSIKVATLEPGDICGEMSIIEKSPRNATLVCKSRTTVLTAFSDNILKIMGESLSSKIKHVSDLRKSKLESI